MVNEITADDIIWKEYLEKGNMKKSRILENSIKEDKIVVCDYIFTKILRNIRNKETFEKLLKGFLALPYVEIKKRKLNKRK